MKIERWFLTFMASYSYTTKINFLILDQKLKSKWEVIFKII